MVHCVFSAVGWGIVRTEGGRTPGLQWKCDLEPQKDDVLHIPVIAEVMEFPHSLGQKKAAVPVFLPQTFNSLGFDKNLRLPDPREWE